MTYLNTRAGLMATAAAITLAFVSGGRAAAQTAGPAPQTEATEVGQVLVTAQKRSEKIQDVPTAITVLRATSLVKTDSVGLADYFRDVPGLVLFDNGYGNNKLVIRGITTGQGETPTVGIYIDDTPIGGSTQLSQGDLLTPDIDPSDLQQIEVLKGPQGTLYGAGSMGGIFKYTTLAPNTNKYSAVFGASFQSVDGGGDGGGVHAGANIPIIPDELAVRFSGQYRQNPGFISDIDGNQNTNSSQSYGGRFALLWTPTDRLSVELSAMSQDRLSNGLNREDYNFITNQPIYGDLLNSRIPHSNDLTMRSDIYNATVKDNFGWATLTSSTSYADGTFAGPLDLSYDFGFFGQDFGIPNFGTILDQAYTTEKFTQEFRLASNSGGPIDWLAGVFYTHELSHYIQDLDPIFTNTGEGIPGFGSLSQQTIKSYYQEVALFGSVTYHLTSQFDIQGGLRYAYNNQGDANFQGGPPSLGSSHEGALTFLVTPEYKITEDQMIYARIASGYRPGGPNYTLVAQAPFKSDSLINYEVGFKSDFLDHKAYIDLDAFYIAWNDIQLEGVDSNSEIYFTNGGTAVSQGFEASGQYHPIRGLTLGGNFTYTDAHLTQNAANDIYAPSGSRLPYSPRVAGQVSINYDFATDSAGWTPEVGGDYSYFGDRASDFENSITIPRVNLPAYSVVNLHVGLENATYSVTVFAKNLTNSRGINSAAPLSLARTLDQYTVTVIQPLTFGATLQAKF